MEDVAARQGMFLAGRDGQHTMRSIKGCLVELQQLMNEPPLYNIYIYIIIIIILYLSAHVQRTKQALGIAPHEALFKKNKHTKSLLRHYKELLTVTQIFSSTTF